MISENQQNETGLDQFPDEDLLLSVVFLSVKPFTSLIGFLEGYGITAKFQFRKNKIECIYTKYNDANETESVYNSVIPEWKLFSYECRTEMLKDYDPENPCASSFALEFNPASMTKYLKKYGTNAVLKLKYYIGTEFLLMSNVGSESSPVRIIVRQYGKTKLRNPINDEICSNKSRPFIKVTGLDFTLVMSNIAKTQDHQARQMGFKIQDYENFKAMKIYSQNEEDCSIVGNYRDDLPHTVFFKVKPLTMKSMSLFCKGNQKTFLNFYYNKNIIKITWEVEYIYHEFYYIKIE